MATSVPKNVSPLIRAGRWSLLLAGLVYGRMHHNTLQAREERDRKTEINRVTQDAIDQIADKKVRGEQSMLDLAKAAGVAPKTESPASAQSESSKKSTSSSKHH